MQYSITLFFIFFSLSVFSQITQPLRYEIEIDDFYDPYFIVSAEEKGIFIFKEMPKESTFKENVWEIIRLDTLLQEVDRQEIIIDKKFNFKGYDYQKGRFVMLFQEGRDYAEDLLFISFMADEFHIQTYIYDNLVPINLTEFEMKNDAVVFGGNVNTRAALMMYNFTAERGVVLPGFYNDRSSLLQIVTKSDDEWVRIITSERRYDKSYGITVRAYSTQGELMFTQNIDGEENISLTDGRIVDSSKGGDLLAGTYSTKRRRETSRGLYIADLSDPDEKEINFYNYADLDNFFNYMREKRKDRIKKRIARKKIKGKKLRFSYRLYVQDIVKQKDQNILIGEGYYPTYTNSSSGFMPYSTDAFMTRNSAQVFDGYKYTHAVLMGFNDEGKLLWDNSFEINDLKSFQLEKHIHLAFTEDQIIMLYLFKQQLKVKVIKGQEIVEGKFSEDLKLLYDDDEVKANNDELEGLENWYDNTFFAYGVNRVKNLRDNNIELNRKVFFINKIVVK
ncbi:hypothetical protein JKA74_10125 [Marivirga sp. S37H4]|uniref:Uncharacterized protein n=1 Tax=Marivirga aurantiaca TaxID=2802615 RepID=A0A935CBI7_9BACT|nr:hypothetical protein [Marivirga aurantiaca]MBK6265393.1 hypothetical protein [Marivirga aurantiaca]